MSTLEYNEFETPFSLVAASLFSRTPQCSVTPILIELKLKELIVIVKSHVRLG